MAEEGLPTEQEAQDEIARRNAFTEQTKARHESDARMLGNLRSALLYHGFTDKGAEALVLAWYGDWIAFNHHMELFYDGDDDD